MAARNPSTPPTTHPPAASPGLFRGRRTRGHIRTNNWGPVKVTLRGQHLYPPGDVDADGKPTVNAPDPTVEFLWTDAAGTGQHRQLALVKEPAPLAPSDTQLTVTILTDLINASALPLIGKLRVERADKQSNPVDLTVTN
jgi:hypothetical protein